ncbi:AAA family ATPase [Lachnospira multipara]|uniref:AAA family ATPase n=1 Tax=Lachnospira multipara TaxID=28051 RepID=UPI0003FA0739|nr:AAA family ATPase [Lachnospira multipara]
MATAYDYLKDFSTDKKCDAWIKLVIEAFVITRGRITDDIKKELVDCLLGRAVTTTCVKSAVATTSTNDTVVLKKLKHLQGVNALANNQTITLNKEVNVIYGLNGSGKSSYFRLIQTMIGNIEHKDLLHNVYSGIGDKMEAELSYSLGGVDKKVTWNNTSIIDDIESIRVFDSSYTSDFLKKRNSDELVLKPYHLDSFAKLVDLINELKDKAYDEIEVMESSLPTVNTEFLSDTIKIMLEQDEFSDDDEKTIADSRIITEADRTELDQLNSLVESLQKSSPEDKIAQFQAEIALCNTATKKIEDCINEINRIIKESKEEIKKYREFLTENEKLQQQISIFKSLPGTGSDLWIDFIRKADEYKEENKLDVCPYCHRPYDDNALEIAEAYTIFLKDKSTEGLHIAEKAISKLENDCKRITIPELEEMGLGFLGADVNKIDMLLANVKKIKKDLAQSIRDKSAEVIGECEITNADCIKAYADNISEQILKLNESDEERKKSLIEAKNKIAVLMEIQSIDSQKKNIIDLIQKKNKISELKKTVDSKSTNKITAVAKKANQDLLTSQLKDKFEKNLSLMGVKDKTIELVGSNSKGVQQTELVISTHKKIANILSEGEQKVCALALFLAEIFVAENKSTIILDDPVNSLDHKMMAAFADVLLQLENQVIVFTHNRMFLDCIEVSDFGHVCKTMKSACNKSKGKHIYVYETHSEGKNDKGVVFEKNQENAEFFISESKKLLAESPFVEKDKTCVYIRKSVECLIDEVVFNKQVPTRFSRKSSRIDWNGLKKVSVDVNTIDDLKSIHNRVSGGDLHKGTESEENPVDKEELQRFVDRLESIRTTSLIA